MNKQQVTKNLMNKFFIYKNGNQNNKQPKSKVNQNE
jgi:hypothetical protein